jgi:hypothetical protein
LQAHNFKKVN